MIAPATVMKTASQMRPASAREQGYGAMPLARRGVFSRHLSEGETVRIRALEGHLWVTMEASPEDHHLPPGSALAFNGPGLLVAEAIGCGALLEAHEAHASCRGAG